MGVRVDYSRQHGATVQIDGPGLGPYHSCNGLVGTYGDYTVPAQRHRPYDGTLCILGVNVTVQQRNIRRCIARGCDTRSGHHDEGR